LFLFANEQGKQMFTADPAAFANADLAFGGQCAVCRVDMRQAVAGKPQFTEVHNGLRYRFPSAEQRGMFLANPKKYEDVGTSVRPATGGSGSRQPVGFGSGSR
jgi:YHS domain-containing protein